MSSVKPLNFEPHLYREGRWVAITSLCRVEIVDCDGGFYICSSLWATNHNLISSYQAAEQKANEIWRSLIEPCIAEDRA